MTATTVPAASAARWDKAFALAAGGHGAALALALLLAQAPAHQPEEPVMRVELPPLPPGLAASQSVAQQVPQTTQPQPQTPAAKSIEAPPATMPLPPEAVTVPPKASPQAPPAPPVSAPATLVATTFTPCTSSAPEDRSLPWPEAIRSLSVRISLSI